MQESELKHYLSDKYQGWESFRDNVVLPIFGKDDYEDNYETELLDNMPERRHLADATGIKSIKQCASVYVNGEPLYIFDITVADRIMMKRNRVGVQTLIRSVMEHYSGAFMIFHYEEENCWQWRFSFSYKGTNDEESTDRKRYTFLLGQGQSCRTAAINFCELYNKSQEKKLVYQDLINAFSVEALSDEFFNGYKAIYADIIFYITGKRMVKKGNKWEEVKEGRACRKILDEFSKFADPEKAVRDYVKKLMGRLVFLQFLQKKGWLGVPLNEEWGNGDHEFIQNLFANTKDKDNFVDGVLEAIFNDLNTEREGDKSKKYKFKIPYLNGGLFERDAADKTSFPLPAKYMENMLDFFSQYNFTIDENDPNDAEVGVDPEMLGRIFENLLEDNKDKGAFYTPKEIVTYMCRESLIAYLQTDIEDEATKEAIRQFVTTHDSSVLGTKASPILGRLKETLKNVKICDPAIGSGAFPMGLLKELFLCRTALEGIEQSKAAEIKKHIIQQNIYGVDIERGAVDIARLRFWLSLIVDEETPQALPNLDFKIMQGNSLLEQYKGVDLSKLLPEKEKDEKIGLQATFFDAEFGMEQKELKELLDKYYECANHEEKKELRQTISATIRQQIHDRGLKVDFGNLDLSGNDQFFLWHTWFHDVFSQGGFDIVIGNPPYVRQEKMEHSYKQLLCSVYPNYGEGTADMLVYFFGQGVNILKNNGVLNYITSNKFLKTKYGRTIRTTFANNVDVVFFIDFFELPVFNNASTDAGITLLIKQEPISTTKYFPVKTLENLNLTELTKGSFLSVIKNIEEWQFVRNGELSILYKLNENSIPLTEFVEGRIYSGVKTGHNPSFMLNRSVREQILNSCQTPEEFDRTNKVIKKAFRSRDIRKYSYNGPELWLLYIPWHFPIPIKEADEMEPSVAIVKAEKLIQKDYPALYSYLCSHKKELSERNAAETGIRYEWYALQRYGSNYSQEFDEEKLIYIHTAKKHEFYYDKDKHYVNNSCYIIASQSKFLYCFLNSSLFDYFKRIKFVAYGDGAEKGRCKLDGNKMATVPIKSGVDEPPYEEKFNKIQSLINEGAYDKIKNIESEIDQLIYHLYGLTYDEVLIVDPENPITREEYEQNI